MAIAVNQPHRFRWHRTTGRPATAAEAGVRARPLGASLTGLGALLVGAWGAVAVYVGPYFGFRPTTAQTWDWNLQNGLLHLLPGAVAFAAGLMLLAMGPARRNTGVALTLPALLLMAAGAWFVVGPVAWPTFESGAAYAQVASASRNLLNQACASLAPGLVLAALGGMAWKAGVARPVIEPVGAPMGEEPVAARDPLTAREETVGQPLTTRHEAVTGAEPAGADPATTASREPVFERRSEEPGAGTGTGTTES